MMQVRFSHQVVEYIPEQLEEGVVYVSRKYGTAVHKCACGCREEVVTPLNPTDWSLRLNKRGVTLHPSIGNWSFACQSHYFIRQGRVLWAGKMSRRQIEWGRALDRASQDQYFKALNASKRPRTGFFSSAWSALRRWCSFLA